MNRDEIHVVLERVNDRLDKIDTQLEINNRHLQEHMSRTAINELILQNQREHFEFRQDAIEKRIEKQEDRFNSLPVRVLQLVSIVGGVAALIRTLFH